MTIRDLLTMSSGFEPDWNMRSRGKEWIRTFLSKPVKEPGTQYAYDSMVSYMLAAVVQKVTGKKSKTTTKDIAGKALGSAARTATKQLTRSVLGNLIK